MVEEFIVKVIFPLKSFAFLPIYFQIYFLLIICFRFLCYQDIFWQNKWVIFIVDIIPLVEESYSPPPEKKKKNS